MDVENLVLEHLRAIRHDMGRLFDGIAGLKTEMIGFRMHGLGTETLQARDHADIADLKTRVDRIERRLEIVD